MGEFNPDNAGNIPARLQAMTTWLLWQRRRQHPSDKGTKVPVRLEQGRPILTSRHDPAAHLSFADAVAASTASGGELGLELYLPEGCGLAALDFDDCISSTGDIDADVAEYVALAGSYTERSPSGRGVRVFGHYPAFEQGSRRTGKTKTGKGVERFAVGHAPTVTGDVIADRPLADLAVVMEALEAGPFKKQEASKQANLTSDDPEFDRELLLVSLGKLKPARACGYFDWLKVGSALSRLRDDTAADLFVAFSKMATKSDDPYVRLKFDEADTREKLHDLADGCDWSMAKATGTLMAMAAEDAGVSLAEITIQAAKNLGRNRAGHAERAARVSIGGRQLASQQADTDRPLDDIPIPEPDPLGWLPFPSDTLPEPVRSFVLAVAASAEVEPAVVAHLCLSVAATAVGTYRRLQFTNLWRPYPIIWTANIAYSGEGKSPALAAVMQPLADTQATAMEAYRSEQAEYEQALDDWKAAKRQAKPGAPVPEKPTPPGPMPVHYVAKTTMEAAQSLLASNPRGFASVSDELAGWLGGMNKYSRGTDEEAFWLTCHDGGTFPGLTKTDGMNMVGRCACWIIGGLQPDKAREVLDESRRSSGLVPRLLFCQPPARASTDTTTDIDPAVLQAWENLVRGLLGLQPEPDGQAVLLTLSPEAEGQIAAYHKRLGKARRSMTGACRSAFSKLKETPLRLAIVLHEVGHLAPGEWSPERSTVISGDTMARACRMAEWWQHEARRAYRLLELDSAGFSQATAVDLMQAALQEELAEAGRPMTRGELLEACKDVGGKTVLVAGLGQLLARGLIARTVENDRETFQLIPQDRPTIDTSPTYASNGHAADSTASFSF